MIVDPLWWGIGMFLALLVMIFWSPIRFFIYEPLRYRYRVAKIRRKTMPIETLYIIEMETVPEPVQAVQVTEDNLDQIAAWVGATSISEYRDLAVDVRNITFNREREGNLQVQIGYWIVLKEDARGFDKLRTYSDENFQKAFRNPTQVNV